MSTFNEKAAEDFYQGYNVKWSEVVEGKMRKSKWNNRFWVALAAILGLVLGLILS